MNSTTDSPRLSIRIPRNFHKQHHHHHPSNEPLSPRTTTVSHPSSSSKEVPRAAAAALYFTENAPPSTSELTTEISSSSLISPSPPLRNDSAKNHDELVADSIQGLKALAASAAASSLPIHKESDKIDPSFPSTTTRPSSPSFNEDEALGKLFNNTTTSSVQSINQILKAHCTEELCQPTEASIENLIMKANSLVQSKGISMSLNSIFGLFIQRLSSQESTRTGNSNLSLLLTNERFMSAAASILLSLPRLVSIVIPMEEVVKALHSDIFDVLLTVEPLLRALPEILQLPNTIKRLQELQETILEESAWKHSSSSSCTLYKLMSLEASSFSAETQGIKIQSTRLKSALNGVRSCQKALETLTGFSTSPSKISRLELFFRKFLRLASHRLQIACTRLGLKPKVTQLAWEFFYELIQMESFSSSSSETQDNFLLFKNRNLNQIILAVIYCSGRLLDQERTFQQIIQVVPTVQGRSISWLLKVFKDHPEDSCDFFTFYNETFLPLLKDRISSFLADHNAENFDEDWIVNELFTSAPLPSNRLHLIGGNSTASAANPRRERFKGTSTKYHWISPFTSTTTQDQQPQPLIQTPSNTSQLLNITTEPETDLKKREIRLIHDSGFSSDERIKKISRRLDFNDEC